MLLLLLFGCICCLIQRQRKEEKNKKITINAIVTAIKFLIKLTLVDLWKSINRKNAGYSLIIIWTTSLLLIKLCFTNIINAESINDIKLESFTNAIANLDQEPNNNKIVNVLIVDVLKLNAVKLAHVATTIVIILIAIKFKWINTRTI